MSKFTTLTSKLALAIFTGVLPAATTTADAQSCACSAHQEAGGQSQTETTSLNQDGTGLTRFETEHIDLIDQFGRPHIASKFRSHLRQLPTAAARAAFIKTQLNKLQMSKSIRSLALRPLISAPGCSMASTAANRS